EGNQAEDAPSRGDGERQPEKDAQTGRHLLEHGDVVLQLGQIRRRGEVRPEQEQVAGYGQEHLRDRRYERSRKADREAVYLLHHVLPRSCSGPRGLPSSVDQFASVLSSSFSM
ncbi:hypothetical protein PMAYCL1PPCAC_27506, partial [Pristionchus mayeri]